MQGVEIYFCANGLALLIWERHDAPVVSVRMGVGTGSMLEGVYGGSGISHLTEHMVFKGTHEKNARELNEYVASLGGIWNAYTSSRHTVYHIDGPAQHWRPFMHQLVQLTLHPTFPEEEWERERDVIRREMDMCADDPEEALQRALAESLYSGNPARYPVIGLRGIFDALRREDLLRYHAECYVPGNMFMIVVGDVSAKDVLAAAQEEMNDVPPRTWLQPPCAPEVRQWGNRVCRREFAQSFSSLCLAWRIPNRQHPDMAPLSMLASILGHGRSAWLQRVFHDERALAYDTAAYLMPHEPGQGAIVVRADVDRARRDELRDALLSYIRQLPDKDFTDALARMKKYFLVQRSKEMTTITSAAEVLTSTWCAAHNTGAYDEWGEALQRITTEDVQRVARQYLLSPCVTEVSVDPTGSNPSAHTAEKEEKISKTRITKLSNGLRCMTQHIPSCQLLFISLAVGGGTRAETAAQAGISTLLAEVMPMGTKTLNTEEIATRVEHAGASLHTDAGKNSVIFSLRCLPQDGPDMLRLLADVALHPALDKQCVSTAREDQLACLREELLSPVCVARRELLSLCYGLSSYGLPSLGTLSSVGSLTSAKLRRMHNRLFCGNNAVLSLVGAVDTRRLLPVVRQVFSEMPCGEALSTRKSPSIRTRRKHCSTAEPTHQAAYALAMPGLPLRHRWQPMLTLLDEWCSDMSGPLYSELRERSGLVYHVGSEIVQGVDSGCFSVQLETSPELLRTARSALHSTLEAMAKRNITEEELERARATAISSCLLSLQSPSRRASSMALDLLLGLGVDYTERMSKALSKVTLGEMQSFVQYMLSSQQPRCSVNVSSSCKGHKKAQG